MLKITKKMLIEIRDLIKNNPHKKQIEQYIDLYNHYSKRNTMAFDFSKSQRFANEVLVFSGWSKKYYFEYNEMTADY